VETVAALHRHGGSLAEVAHDARNMVTALSLYCDLLEEPGVLAASYRHYASELRLVAEGSRRLVEKLSAFEGDPERGSAFPPAISSPQGLLFPTSRLEGAAEPLDGIPIEDLGEELVAIRDLLAAIAGPSVTVTAAANGGAWPVAMTGENLIRALVNLVRNATESIGGPGAIQLTLDERRNPSGEVSSVVLCVEDSGNGIPAELLDRIFEAGFTTHADSSGRRGLGLAITRSIVEEAGGRIEAENRAGRGARFRIELPVAESSALREQELRNLGT
jgi:signal transduction histidine kinase